MMKFNFLGFLVFISSASFSVAQEVGIRELFENLNSKSPELHLQNLEADILKHQAQANYGKILPELGVEGGGYSSREKEKRTDTFYYGYARYELTLGDILNLRSAFKQSQLASLAREQASLQARLNLAEIYYRGVSLQKHIALKTADMDLAEKQLSAARKRVDAGLATESDILEFKMHQQEIQNDLRTLKMDFEFSLREIERRAGLSNNSLRSLKEDFISQEQAASFDEDWKNIEAQNFSLRQAKVNAISAKIDKGSAFGEFMPKLSAEAQYGKLSETDFIVSKKNSWEVVGKVTMPLFNGGASFRRLQEKSAQAEKAEVITQQTYILIRSKAQNLFEKISELKQKRQGEEQNIKLSEKYFDLVMSEYRRGVKNSPDVAGATDKLFEARLRLLETRVELSLRTLEFLAMLGKSI